MLWFKVALGYILSIVLTVRALLTFNGRVWLSNEQPTWPQLAQSLSA